MKSARLILLVFFVFSVAHVTHAAIFDNILNTVKEIGSGAQKIGDDVLGAFMLPTSKCKNGPCTNADKVKVLDEHNVNMHQMQPTYGIHAAPHMASKRSAGQIAEKHPKKIN